MIFLLLIFMTHSSFIILISRYSGDELYSEERSVFPEEGGGNELLEFEWES